VRDHGLRVDEAHAGGQVEAVDQPEDHGGDDGRVQIAGHLARFLRVLDLAGDDAVSSESIC
jgi:hypothetical protein